MADPRLLQRPEVTARPLGRRAAALRPSDAQGPVDLHGNLGITARRTERHEKRAERDAEVKERLRALFGRES